MEHTLLHVRTRKDLRKWLRRNHARERRVSLILDKRHTGKPAPSHRELIEEAICFGWIDTTIKRLDEDRFVRNFVKRNKKSRWSENTQRYARELIASGKMTKVGLKAYEDGLLIKTYDRDFKWSKGSKDLDKALENSKKAKKFYERLAPSYKKLYVMWVETAKRPETRKKRLKESVKRLKEMKKLNE
jgi:uncharacterized protein YdeI (YjbR/CyaY-like superfamily)